MFKITRNSTLPNTIIPTPQSIFVPCFQLTNSVSTLTSFASMFKLEHINEVAEVVDDYTFSFSSIPSQYQVVEMDILSLPLIEDIETLYLNGSKYQNLLSIDEFNLINSGEDSLLLDIDTLPIEEREST